LAVKNIIGLVEEEDTALLIYTVIEGELKGDAITQEPLLDLHQVWGASSLDRPGPSL